MQTEATRGHGGGWEDGDERPGAEVARSSELGADPNSEASAGLGSASGRDEWHGGAQGDHGAWSSCWWRRREAAALLAVDEEGDGGEWSGDRAARRSEESPEQARRKGSGEGDVEGEPGRGNRARRCCSLSFSLAAHGREEGIERWGSIEGARVKDRGCGWASRSK